MTTENLELRRGDTHVFDLTILNAAGTAMNLTGATVRFTAKNNLSDADGSAVITKISPSSGIVVTDAAGGLARLTLLPADTSSITQERVLYYDVQVTDGSSVVTTVLEGTLAIRLDVSVASP